MDNSQYNPQGSGAQYTPNYASNANRALKKPMDKDFILFLGSIAACVVGVIAFFVVANSSFGYENVGKKFFYSIVTNNPDDAFEMLDVKEDAFVNKTVFAQNYGLTEDIVKAIDDKALKDVQFESKVEKDGKTATVYATSTSSSDVFGEYDALSIDVVRDGNVFGIFPNWKVDSKDILAKNVTFAVPTGAKLEVNGKEVDAKYMDNSNAEEGYDNYIAPVAIKGYIPVSCSVEGLEASPSYELIYQDDDTIRLEYGAPSQDTLNDIAKNAYDALTTVVNSAAEGKDFSSLTSSIEINGDTSKMQEMYNSLIDDFALDATQTGVTSVDFSNVKIMCDYQSFDAEPKVRVDITADMAIHHNTKSFFSDTISDSVEDDSYRGGVYYILKDGKWIIDSDMCNLVPYFWVSNYSD